MSKIRVEDDFEQLSCIVDDVCQHIARLKSSPIEKAALSSLALTRLSMFARKEMLAALFAGEPLGDETEQNLKECMRQL